MNSVRDNCNAGKVIESQDAKKLLLSVIRSGDRVVIEGNNQKQATFLSKQLADYKNEEIQKIAKMLDEKLAKLTGMLSN